MAKGKANPALTIVVWGGWLSRPEIRALHEAGHAVGTPDSFKWESEPDLILHPAAHAWGDTMWETPYLKAALTAARKRHRERKKANGA